MKKVTWISALCLGVLAVVPAWAASPTLQGGAMLWCSGLPCIDVSLQDGKHLRMLIGLGDADTVVDLTAAKNLGIAAGPTETAVLNGVHLGAASLGDISIQVKDLRSKIEKKQLPQADGVLGYNAFHDRLVQIDYKRQAIRVSEPLTADVKCSGFCGDISMVDFAKDDPPVLATTGFSINGKSVIAQVDTLYTGTMVVYPAAIAKLDLQMQSGVNAIQFFPYTDGGVGMREGHAKTEAFGPRAIGHNAALFFAMSPMPTPDGSLDATVGAGLLTGHVLYIDLHSKHLWMTN